MKNQNYVNIVHDLYKLSAQGVAHDDARFVQKLSELSLEREKRGSADSDVYGPERSTYNPISRAQYERLLQQIDMVTNYLSVGADIPEEVIRRYGVDQKKVDPEKHKEEPDNSKEVLYYAEILHRNKPYWRTSLGWLEYNEVMSDNALSYRSRIVGELLTILQFSRSKGAPDCTEAIELNIHKLGLESFVSQFRVAGVLNMEELMPALTHLDRQLRLLGLQRLLKIAMRFSRHLYLPQPSNAKAWHRVSAVTGWNEHVRNFNAQHREIAERSAFLARSVFIKRGKEKKNNEMKGLLYSNQMGTDGSERILSTDILLNTRRERMKTLLNTCRTYMNSVMHVVNKEGEHSSVGADVLESLRNTTYTLKNSFVQPIAQIPRIFCAPGLCKQYHREGVAWLLHLFNNNLNCVLADDYKLNRVLHVILLLTYLKEMKAISGPHLIVAPLASIESMWLAGLEEWYPSCAVCPYIGSKVHRREISSTWPEYFASRPLFDVLFTTDHVLEQDFETLKRIKWEYVIIDGLDILANRYNYTLRHLNSGFECRRRLLLATEPLDQSVQDLWPVTNFLFPDMYDTAEPFYLWFVQPFMNSLPPDDLDKLQPGEEELENISEVLNNALSPCVLSRSEAAYPEFVQEYVQHIVYCPMSGVQTRLFDFFKKCYKGEDLNKMLQRICNHPYSLCPDSYYCDDTIVSLSGKFAMLDICITRLANAHRRTLIITPDSEILLLLEVLLHLRSVQYVRIEAQESIEILQRKLAYYNSTDEDIRVAIVPKQGCKNLMLTATNTVISFEAGITPDFLRENKVLEEEEAILLRLAIPNVTDDPYLMENEVELPPSLLKLKSASSTVRRQEFRSGALHSLYYLDKLMLRSVEDERLFFLSDLYRYLSQVVLLVDELMVPPCIFQALSRSGKFKDEELQTIKIEDVNWYTMMDTYDVWLADPNEILTARLKTYYNPETIISTYNTITGLPLCYPIGRANSVRGMIENMFLITENQQVQYRAIVMNSMIEMAAEQFMNIPEFVIFTDNYKQHLYGPQWHMITNIVTLNDIRSLAGDRMFPSIGSLNMYLERISRNVRMCLGNRSDYFFRSLDLYHQVNRYILRDIPVAFLWLTDQDYAQELQRLYEDLQRLYE